MKGESSGTSKSSNPTELVDNVFKDFKGRRKGLIKALSTDFHNLLAKCDAETEFVSLFGLPNGTWEVREPDENVPPDIPDPLFGINNAPDMEVDEWKTMIAIHSDSWLMSVASSEGANLGFRKKHRKELFEKINALPTLHALVTNEIENSNEKKRKRMTEEDETSDEPKTSTSRTNIKKRKTVIVNRLRLASIPEEPERGSTCGACGVRYGRDGLRWITCDDCERMFHVNCTTIVPVKAESIKIYKCPFCKQDDADNP